MNVVAGKWSTFRAYKSKVDKEVNYLDQGVVGFRAKEQGNQG